MIMKKPEYSRKIIKITCVLGMLCSMLMLPYTVHAEEIAQPTEEDYYCNPVAWDEDKEETEEEDGYIRFDHVVVIDKIAYQYRPERDNYAVVAFDHNSEPYTERTTVTLLSEVRGKPVREVKIGSGNGPYGEVDLIIPDSVKKVDIRKAEFVSVTLPDNIKVKNIKILGALIQHIYNFPKTKTLSGLENIWKLKSFEIPKGTKKIGKCFLAGSTELNHVVITDSVTEIEGRAFAGCENLTIYIPSSVKKIGKYAFEDYEDYEDGGYGGISEIYCEKDSVAYRYAIDRDIPYTLVKSGKSTRKVSKIKVRGKEVKLTAGQKKELNYEVKPFYAANKKMKFKSSKPSVVSVNAKGILTAKKAGSAKITIQAKDGSKKKAYVTVKVK